MYRVRVDNALHDLVQRTTQLLEREPRGSRMVLALVALTVALYAGGLSYPPVFGEFALLASGKLAAAALTTPALGAAWLADASFGGWAKLVGQDLFWHRVLNLVLHCLGVVFVFLLSRRVAGAAVGSGVRAGWIAFFAAGLFALHPVVVYAVAYLPARGVLLLGVFVFVGLWSVARAAQDGWRGAWAVAPFACAGALLCSPSAIALPAAMAWLVYLTAPHGTSRAAWWAVVAAASVSVAYGVVVALTASSGVDAAGMSYLEQSAANSSRLLRYLGYGLVPITAWMAIDMPEAAPHAAAWNGWGSMLGIAALAFAVVWSRRNLRYRGLAIALGALLLLAASEIFWPRLANDFALWRGYMGVALLCLALVWAIALLGPRASLILGFGGLTAWAVLSVLTLQTFSSHVAVWDDAIRAAGYFGPDAKDARLYVNRATLHRTEGHALAALADYDRALTLQPGHARALRGRAQLHIDEKRYPEALKDLDRLLELEPGQIILHADRGLVLMQIGKFSEAMQAFNTAIGMGAREPKVFLNRSLAVFQMGGLGAAPLALTDIERAIALDPSYALAYFNRALIFEQAAQAGMRLRDAVSPELMRAVATQNIARACQLGHGPACDIERARAASKSAEPPGLPATMTLTPEELRTQGLPLNR